MKTLPQLVRINHTKTTSNFKDTAEYPMQEAYTTIFLLAAKQCTGKCGKNCCKRNKNQKCCSEQAH